MDAVPAVELLKNDTIVLKYHLALGGAAEAAAVIEVRYIRACGRAVREYYRSRVPEVINGSREVLCDARIVRDAPCR